MILSCGGGAPTYKKSFAILKRRTTVIWLKRPLSTIRPDSPLLSRPPVGGSLENYRRLYGKRFPTYKRLADWSCFNLYPNRTAETLAAKLR